MKNTDNVTIGLLVATAAILVSLLLVLHVFGGPAHASGVSVKDGDYVITVATYDQNTDLVYVLDADMNRLNVYTVDINTNSIRIGDTVDLSKLFRGP